ncbi:MAG: EthD domain-containing protein [Candidatus Binatia bacterium]
MIRLNFALQRLPNLSRIEFQRYWRDRHGPLVASVARPLRMRRYMQSHTVEDPLYDGLRAARTGMHEPFDGIASVWFDSREELIAAMTGEEGRKAGALLLEDERRFIDLSRSPLWASQEIVQINPMPENSIVAWPNSSWIKFCYLLQPKAGMSQAACHKTWNMEHGYLIRRHSGCTRFARYIQNHTLEDELNDQLRASRGGPPPYAGLTEAWFDRYDLVKIFADPTSEGARGFNAFLEDEKRFIDFTRSSVWAAKEIVFVDEGTV